METIKLKFDYFWDGFNQSDNFLTKLLSKRYNIEISEDPEFYFFTHSYFGRENYLKYKCHRIFLGWENARANWNICDYALDSDFCPDNKNHKRLPLWATLNTWLFTEPKNISAFLEKKKFCCMLISNPKAKERIDFFHKLSSYKKVDSAGRYLNNVGFFVESKEEFIKDYKFVISFENSSSPGYTTEKLIQPMLMNSIPIYWGNPAVEKDFNTKSFVNVQDFNSFEEAVQHIIKLDKDDSAYMEMVFQPWFNENKIPAEFCDTSLLDFFDFIFKDSKTKKPVARSIYKSCMHRLSLLKTKAWFVVSKKIKINKNDKQ